MRNIIDTFRLDGKVAIVTGAGRGLGQGMALALAEAGADIVCIDCSGESDETAATVKKLGRGYEHIQADLRSIEGIPAIIETSKKAFGTMDILVNNAGIIKRNDSVDFTEQEWDDVMNINIKTVFFLCQAVAKEFIAQGAGGKIVNIASMLSFQGGIRAPSYTASKSGIKGITMLMANEWAKFNINVNAIAPGYMATDNTVALRADEQRSKEILDRIPAGRWGSPQDLGGAAVFLSSKAADYINGYTIAVDGGWLAR
ncbi:2-deoxy-D-gluconate 3-dehydrogenase [Alkalispirochaeta americana]|uniref:2-dehydro-3-deoxy-D-gluconate 5-dehydrogenase n=1 Tax=Alkalispirochaeta americana TaxID=159291 RepID=A0A1N6XMC9_9SPIO|nr:2-dehydro-3-deoxy-D-gluconate 5-dehydrogenase KduD [Alkalispirochaeta americana]SIR03514.1 2-deoxy-D-gluconate 3-dehydrogenase [Alkalispirochaeta americana]